MTTTSWPQAPALAFDELAPIYDEVFTHSLIGQAQRRAVWKRIDRVWKDGDHVLELNCGTGEDALHLASMGIRVTACDCSAQMLGMARRKEEDRGPQARVEFIMLSNECIGSVRFERPFDGVFSNFSGLNCVQNLSAVALQLAGLVRPGAELVFCFSTRFCAWECLWYAIRGEFRKAVRRWSGRTVSALSGRPVEIWYPTVTKIKSDFQPWFEFRGVSGIGVTIPPSYAEGWAQKHSRIFSLLLAVDRWFARLPLVRVVGDHMLLRFRRCS